MNKLREVLVERRHVQDLCGPNADEVEAGLSARERDGVVDGGAGGAGIERGKGLSSSRELGLRDEEETKLLLGRRDQRGGGRSRGVERALNTKYPRLRAARGELDGIRGPDGERDSAILERLFVAVERLQREQKPHPGKPSWGRIILYSAGSPARNASCAFNASPEETGVQTPVCTDVCG